MLCKLGCLVYLFQTIPIYIEKARFIAGKITFFPAINRSTYLALLQGMKITSDVKAYALCDVFSQGATLYTDTKEIAAHTGKTWPRIL